MPCILLVVDFAARDPWAFSLNRPPQRHLLQQPRSESQLAVNPALPRNYIRTASRAKAQQDLASVHRPLHCLRGHDVSHVHENLTSLTTAVWVLVGQEMCAQLCLQQKTRQRSAPIAWLTPVKQLILLRGDRMASSHLDHHVSQLERFSVVAENLQHFRLSTRVNEVRLRQHADRTLSRRVHLSISVRQHHTTPS